MDSIGQKFDEAKMNIGWVDFPFKNSRYIAHFEVRALSI